MPPKRIKIWVDPSYRDYLKNMQEKINKDLKLNLSIIQLSKIIATTSIPDDGRKITIVRKKKRGVLEEYYPFPNP